MPTKFLSQQQCDHIWQNFDTLVQVLKVLGKFLRVYLVFGKILILFWQNVMVLGKFS